jgi:integrase
MRVKLSPTIIARSKPRAKPFELSDADVPGLLLRVQPSGVKSFIVQWGRGRRKTIGRVGKHTVEQMRMKARKILLDAEEHGEPTIASKRSATLGEFFREHYKPHAQTNHKDHANNLKAIETEFAHLFDKPLTAVSAFDLEKYRLAKLRQGVKAVTVNRHFDRLRALFARAVEWKALPSHPLRGLKRSKVDRMGVVRFLSKTEEAALRKALAARDKRIRRERANANAWRAERGYELMPEIPKNGFGDHLPAMVLLSMNTGMRRGELRKICWSDVNFQESILTIRGGYAKSGQTRYVPLNVEALDVLRQWQAQTAGADAIFPILRADKSWKAVLKAAKIERFRWHDLRHHFASRLVQRGVDLNTVRELLGHADIAMTLRYSHLAPGDKAAAVAKLAA